MERALPMSAIAPCNRGVGRLGSAELHGVYGSLAEQLIEKRSTQVWLTLPESRDVARSGLFSKDANRPLRAGVGQQLAERFLAFAVILLALGAGNPVLGVGGRQG